MDQGDTETTNLENVEAEVDHMDNLSIQELPSSSNGQNEDNLHSNLEETENLQTSEDSSVPDGDIDPARQEEEDRGIEYWQQIYEECNSFVQESFSVQGSSSVQERQRIPCAIHDKMLVLYNNKIGETGHRLQKKINERNRNESQERDKSKNVEVEVVREDKRDIDHLLSYINEDSNGAGPFKKKKNKNRKRKNRQKQTSPNISHASNPTSDDEVVNTGEQSNVHGSLGHEAATGDLLHSNFEENENLQTSEDSSVPDGDIDRARQEEENREVEAFKQFCSRPPREGTWIPWNTNDDALEITRNELPDAKLESAERKWKQFQERNESKNVEALRSFLMSQQSNVHGSLGHEAATGDHLHSNLEETDNLQTSEDNSASEEDIDLQR